MNEKIRVLMVTQADPNEAIWAASETQCWNVTMARTCAEARELLGGGTTFDVVVSDLTLPDGNWFCIHQHLMHRDHRPEVIVVAPQDGLDVSEILAHGVFAVPARPVDRGELERTIELAAQAARREKAGVGIAGL